MRDSDEDLGLVEEPVNFLVLGKQVADFEPFDGKGFLALDIFEPEGCDLIVQVDHEVVLLFGGEILVKGENFFNIFYVEEKPPRVEFPEIFFLVFMGLLLFEFL